MVASDIRLLPLDRPLTALLRVIAALAAVADTLPSPERPCNTDAALLPNGRIPVKACLTASSVATGLRMADSDLPMFLTVVALTVREAVKVTSRLLTILIEAVKP